MPYSFLAANQIASATLKQPPDERNTDSQHIPHFQHPLLVQMIQAIFNGCIHPLMTMGTSLMPLVHHHRYLTSKQNFLVPEIDCIEIITRILMESDVLIFLLIFMIFSTCSSAL